MPKFIDLTGRKFHYLIVIKFSRQQGSYSYWWVRCDAPGCGREVEVRGSSLKTGNTKSCGCQRTNTFKHGESSPATRTPEYDVWQGLLKRVRVERYRTGALNPDYRNYGGRGITVCARWRNSYENFLEDMGRRPGPTYTIERIDVNGHYEPGNCTWIPKSEQTRNQRRGARFKHFVMYEGERIPLVEAAERAGIAPATILRRMGAGLPSSLWFVKGR